jgi:23S rRNA G2069 N7-methylase RlmK/C1962 C5-methylase RlmI
MALEARASLFDARYETAFRLFNGFTEGNPDLVIDLYATTQLMQSYAGKGYRVDLLPLFPLDKEIKYWLTRQ